jgi:hypothetical protein
MDGRDISSLDPDTASCSAQRELMLCSFGETTSTIRSQSKRGLSAPSFEMKAHSSRLSLSDKLTPSLITLGLVRGITPKSIRKKSGAEILDFVFSKRAGEGAE